MAYQKQKQQIGIGGLALLPPADRISDTDAVVLQNWRVDQAGQLRSRKGMKRVSAAIAGNGHTLFRGGSGRYAGIGGALRTGDDLSTSVATGFDGNPLGLVEYHDNVWVMNQAKQLRVAAGVGANWSIMAPVQAAAGAIGITPIPQTTVDMVAHFAVFESWGTTDGVISYVPMPGAPQAIGATITIPAYRTTGYYLSAPATTAYQAPPTSISGTEDANDYFTIWVCCSNPAALSQLDLRFISIKASVAGSATVSILPAATGGPWGANQWTMLTISRGGDISSIPGGVATSIPSFTPDEWFDWAFVNQMEIIASANAVVTFSVQELKVTRPDNGLTGTYFWYVVYGSSVTGAKSNPYPAADGTGTQATATLKNAFARLTNLPYSTDPQVDTRYIYRAGGNVNQTLLVGQVANSVAITTFDDTMSETDVQNLDVVMDFDNDPPPPCRGLVGPYYGKLVAWNSAAHPQRYWWTPSAQPWKWPGSNDPALGNWEDCGGSGEALLRITDHKTVLVFYKERSIWRIVGDPDTSDPQKTNANAGLLGASAIVSAGNLDYYGGTEGIFEFNGDFETKISEQIDPIFKGDWADLGNVVIPPMNMAAASTAVMAFIGGRLFFSYPEAGAAVPTVTLVYNIANKTWYTHLLGPGLAATAFSALNYEGPGRNLCGFVSGASATLYELEQLTTNSSIGATTDDGIPIPLIWQTRYYDQSLPDNLKTYSDLVVVYRTAPTGGTPATLNVSLLFDNGAEVQALGTISSATRTTAIFRLNSGEGFDAANAAVRIDGNTSSQVTIFSIYLHYYVQARRAQSFDTGWLDPAGPLVVALERYEADILIPTGKTVSWELITELPGDAMAQRQVGALLGDGTRKPMFATFPILTEGRRVRIVFTVVTAPWFQLWGLRLRLRPWGQYIDGASGDTYSTAEIRLVA